MRVRPNNPILQFYAVYFRPDPDDLRNADYFIVRVGKATVFRKAMIQANDTFPNWVLETVDLSAYAGTTVLLTFAGRSTGDLTGNVLVDDVGFGP